LGAMQTYCVCVCVCVCAFFMFHKYLTKVAEYFVVIEKNHCY
jgi:hypothetical protein